MENISKFLENLYGNSQNMMYFYLGLSILALFFILLIIITLIKSNKETKKEKLKNKEEKTLNEVKTVIENSVQEEIRENSNNELNVKEENNLNNEVINITENKEELIEEKPLDNVEPMDLEENKEELNNNHITNNDIDVYLDKVESPTGNIEPINLEENKEELNNGLNLSPIKEDPKLEGSEFSPLESINLDNSIEEPMVDNKLEDNFSIELPEISDVDKVLDQPVIEPKEEVINQEKDTLPKEKTVVVDNDELKSRLANLKVNKENIVNSKSDAELDQLMKAVGLEDTIVIPKLRDEEQVLGK